MSLNVIECTIYLNAFFLLRLEIAVIVGCCILREKMWAIRTNVPFALTIVACVLRTHVEVMTLNRTTSLAFVSIGWLSIWFVMLIASARIARAMRVCFPTVDVMTKACDTIGRVPAVIELAGLFIETIFSKSARHSNKVSMICTPLSCSILVGSILLEYRGVVFHFSEKKCEKPLQVR